MLTNTPTAPNEKYKFDLPSRQDALHFVPTGTEKGYRNAWLLNYWQHQCKPSRLSYSSTSRRLGKVLQLSPPPAIVAEGRLGFANSSQCLEPTSSADQRGQEVPASPSTRPFPKHPPRSPNFLGSTLFVFSPTRLLPPPSCSPRLHLPTHSQSSKLSSTAQCAQLPPGEGNQWWLLLPSLFSPTLSPSQNKVIERGATRLGCACTAYLPRGRGAQIPLGRAGPGRCRSKWVPQEGSLSCMHARSLVSTSEAGESCLFRPFRL